MTASQNMAVEEKGVHVKNMVWPGRDHLDR